MSLGVVGTTTGATGADVTGDANDTSAASPVQQTPLVSGTNSLTDANTTFAGADANDTFGSALAHGDLNGDGVEDVVVGAPENDSAAGNNSGAVYVFYGPVEEGDIDAESANVTLHGVEAGDRAGYAVAAGDVDDDGTDDLVVGAPLEDTNGQSAGTTYVVDGGSGLPENASLSTADHVLRGEAEGDRAGWSVAAVNRPGGDDVLVGAPGSNASASNAGAAYVVSDADPGVDSLANATAILTGEGEGDSAGWVVAEAGDFDGDGSQDVLVSAPRNNSTAPDAGATYLLTENVTGTVSLADAHLKLRGEAARGRAGWDAAEAGDVNNDSYDDLVVGAPFAETEDSETNAGIAYVVYGGEDDAGTVNLSDAGATLVGSGEDDYAGYSVSSAGSGDVTCDNYADVLVGAPGNNSSAVDAGAVYVVAGSEFPATERNLSTADATLVGEGEGDRAGTAVSDAMDVTGDGDKDVLVGAPLNNSSAVDAGAAYLIAGDCPEPEPEPEPEDVIVTKECVDEQGEVTVTNPNDERVTFTIEGTEYELAANGNSGDSITIDDLDDGDYDWSATTEDGEHVGGGVLTVDCDEPEPENVIVTKDCDNEQGEVTVTNPNDERVTFTIEGDSYTLAADGNSGDSITIDDLDDGDYDWSATTEDGEHVGGGVLTVDCDEPEPEDLIITKECVDEQGEVTITNPNDERVTFTIEGTEYELAANGNSGDSVTLDDLDDGDYDWSATTEDGEHVGGGVLTVDCDEPEPEDVIVTLDCDDEQGELTVVNPNDEHVTFTIEGDSYTLAANGNSGDTLVLDNLNDGNYDWSATTEDGEHVGGGTLTVDCDEPDDVIVDKDCDDEQGEVTITNPNDQKVTFTIEGTEYELAANGNDGDSITLDDLNDGNYDWDAETEDGEHVGGGVLTVDCDEPEPEDLIIKKDCDDEQGGLIVTNPNDERVNFTIDGKTYTLAADGNSGDVVTISDLDDDDYQWNATTVEDNEHIDDGLITVDCDEEEEPDPVTIETKCSGEFDGQLIVVNPNDEPVTFTVGSNSYTLEANGSTDDSEIISFLDDGDYTVETIADGEVIDSQTVEIDCEEPRGPTDTPVVSEDCEQLTLTNPSDSPEAVDFRIRNDSGSSTVDNVEPGESVTIDVSADDYTVDARYVTQDSFGSDNVTVNGQAQTDLTVEDCREPIDTPVVSEDCEQLTLTNPSDSPEAVDFRIRNDSGSSTVDNVAPGESVTIDVSADDYTVDARYVTQDSFGSDNVTVNGQAQTDLTVEDCREPIDTPVVSEDCEQLTLTNPSDSPEAVDFRIRNDSGSSTVDNVAPGESVTIDVSADDYTVDARYVTDDQFGSDNVTVDGQTQAELTVVACEEELEQIGVDADCEDGDGAVHLSNPNDVKVTVTIGDGEETITLGPEGSGNADKTVSGLDDGTYDLSATTTNGDQSVDIRDSVEINCDISGAIGVDKECEDGDGTLYLSNPNDAKVTVTIGDGEETITLGPEGSGNADKTVSGLDDGTYDLSATTTNGDQSVDIRDSVEINCDITGDIGVDKECENGDGTLYLSNPNDAKVTVTIGDGEETITLGPKDSNSANKTVSGLDNGNYDLSATTTNGDQAVGIRDSVEINCDITGDIGVDKECENGDGTLYLSNPNDAKVTVTIGDGEETITLGPKDSNSANKTVSGLDNGNYDLSATTTNGDQAVDIRDSVEINCGLQAEDLSLNVQFDGCGNAQITPLDSEDNPISEFDGAIELNVRYNNSSGDTKTTTVEFTAADLNGAGKFILNKNDLDETGNIILLDINDEYVNENSCV